MELIIITMNLTINGLQTEPAILQHATGDSITEIYPSSRDSNSTVALSVSISQSTSPT